MTARRFALRTLLVAANVVAATFLILNLRQQSSIEALAAPGGRAELVVPPGFAASVFAEGLAGPRFMEFGPDGRLYVAEAYRDRVVALADSNGDGVSESSVEFAGGLPSVHSVTWHQGALYAGITSGVFELRDTNADGVADARRSVVGDLPTDGGHSTRTVVFLADGRMAVSVGSSCNVCVEADRRRAAIVVYDGVSGTGERIFARGLRNAVGLTIGPGGALWATNNGRDWLGDDLPPETLQLVREGEDYGWPRCHAGTLVDPEFGKEDGCRGVAQPALSMQAHSAPLALVFYEAAAFPAEYRGNLFIAFHGSWNRSVPTGFKVVRVRFENGRPAGAPEDFVTGFADTARGSVLGRPAGLAVGRDGALYVSDDKSGFIYRVVWKGGPSPS